MVNKNKRFLTRYEKLDTIIKDYILLMFLFLLIAIYISLMKRAKDIDAGVPGTVGRAIFEGAKWTFIAMPLITVISVLRLIYNSSSVLLTENSMRCFKNILSKEYTEIFYDEIAFCVVKGRLWIYKGKKVWGRNILFYNKNRAIASFGIYAELALNLYLKIQDKLKLVGENETLTTIDKYFKINFANLTYDEQLALLKYYCKMTYTKYKTGEQILSSDRRLKRKNKK